MGSGWGVSQKNDSKFSRRRRSYERVGSETLYDNIADEIASEIDPVQFAVNWGDSSISSLMYTRGIFNFTEGFLTYKYLPDFISNFTRKNLDDISYFIFDKNKVEEIYEDIHNAENIRLTGINLALKLTSVPVRSSKQVLQSLDLIDLIYTGSGVVGPIPLLGSVLAVAAWMNLSFSLFKLSTDIRRKGSYAFWLKEDMHKLQTHEKVINFMRKRIALAEQKIDRTTDEKKKQNLEKILHRKQQTLDELIKQSEEMKQKIIYIAQVKKSKSKQKSLRPELIKFMSRRLGMNENELKEQVNQPPTPQVEALIEQLRKNQRDRVISRSISCAATALTALGATLITISPIAFKAAPAVLGVGLALSIAGTSIHIGKFAIVKSVNLTSKIVINRKVKGELIKEYQNKGYLTHSMLVSLPDDKKLQYRLSFEHSLLQLQKKHNDKNITDLETMWYKSLENMDQRKMKRLLASAEDLGVRNYKLDEVLKLSGKQPDEKKAFIATIPDKDINSIINRYNRNQMAHAAVKKMTPSRFFQDGNTQLNKELKKKYRPSITNLSYRKI